jgi:hypothetical protein
MRINSEKIHIKQRKKRDKIHYRHRLKGPNLEIFGYRVFTQIRPAWVGDQGTRPKIPNFDGLGLKIAVSYFLAMSPTSQKNVKRCRRQR